MSKDYHGDLIRIANEAMFLTSRLSEFESDYGNMDEDVYREYAGHVHPSIARLRRLASRVLENDNSSQIARSGDGYDRVGFIDPADVAKLRSGESLVIYVADGSNLGLPIFIKATE